MATVYSRSAMLITGLMEGTGGAGLQGLAATVTQVIVGTNNNGFATNTITDLAFNNTDATHDAYVQFFDVAAPASVTLGTTAATASYHIPAATAGIFQLNQVFTNGIALAATTTATNATAAVTPITVGVAYL